MADDDSDLFNYSPAYRAVANGAFGLGSNLTWDSYQRELYNKLNAALQDQANLLLRRGDITPAEAQALSAQRTTILLEARKPLSPFGKLYSEILKPSNNLPSFERLLVDKGSVEAVVRSVGKTRAVVNRLSVAMKIGGRGLVVFQVIVSAVVIAEAPSDQRGRVAAEEAGGLAGGAAFGWGGAWAGCASGVALLSPSLVLPVVGEIGEGGACLIGGLAGGFGLGAFGGWGGQKAGGAAYDYVTSLRWLK
jgi:hypothetical protein